MYRKHGGEKGEWNFLNMLVNTEYLWLENGVDVVGSSDNKNR